MDEGRGAVVEAGEDEAANHLGRRHRPAEPQAGRDRLRRGADVEHAAAPGEREQRGRRRAVEVEPRVGVVLDDQQVVLLGDAQQLLAALERHRAPARVVVGGDQVQQLRRRPLRAGERLGERIGAQAVGVLRDVDQPRAARAEGADRAGVGRRADDGDVAGSEERGGDVVDGVRAAGAERDVLRPDGEALGAVPLGDPGAQRRVALRPAVGERARGIVAQRAGGSLRDLRGGQRGAVRHAGVEVVAQDGERGRLGEIAEVGREQSLDPSLVPRRSLGSAHARSLRPSTSLRQRPSGALPPLCETPAERGAARFVYKARGLRRPLPSRERSGVRGAAPQRGHRGQSGSLSTRGGAGSSEGCERRAVVWSGAWRRCEVSSRPIETAPT